MLLGSFPERFYKAADPVEKLDSFQSEALKKFIFELQDNVFSFEDTTCLCGENSGSAITIAKRDRYALHVDTYLCKSCGMLWTSPQMTEDSLRRFYENNYRPIYVGEENASESFFNEQIRHGRAILSFLERYLIKSEFGCSTVFDVGCGAGGVLVPFREAGYNVFGCDYGGKYLEYGKLKGLALEHGGIERLSQYGKAKIIILSHVLEHFKNPLKQLEMLSNVLAEDGYIYIELPGVFNIYNVYRDPLLYFQNAHLFHFTLNTLNILMWRAGFTLIAGNQNISAVYQKRASSIICPGKFEYMKILLYLLGIEMGRIKFCDKIPCLLSRLFCQFKQQSKRK